MQRKDAKLTVKHLPGTFSVTKGPDQYRDAFINHSNIYNGLSCEIYNMRMKRKVAKTAQ